MSDARRGLAGIVGLVLTGLWVAVLTGPTPTAHAQAGGAQAGGAQKAATASGAAGRPAPLLPLRGGSLVATMRSEPRSFNPHAGRDFATHLVTQLLNAKLVRINRATQQLEPWLAETFACAADGLRCTLHLRRGVQFSDGAPLTSADVLFSFQVVYDEKTGSPLGDAMLVGGKPLVASAPDANTVVITFPSAFGPGLRLLDSLPILPRHTLERALQSGTLRKEWGPTVAPGDVVGLGPFVLQDYKSGERIVFARNPHYWRTDAAGTTLPYLDRLIVEITPDQNTELLRLQSGQADLTQSEIRPDDYALLKREAAAGTIRLVDAGLSFDADAFWLNLKPDAKAADPRRAWMQSLGFRKAISLAVNRQAFVDAVFLGAAEPTWGPVSPSNTTWYPPPSSQAIDRHGYDPTRARAELARLNLRDANLDGMLEDRAGAAVRFALVTQKGNTALEKGAAFIRDELKKVGVAVDVVPLEVGALVDRMTKGDYDALYFRFLTTDTDPAMNLDFWLSSGGAHVWNIDQPKPATPWEAQIDEVVSKMAAERQLPARQTLFLAAQKILSDNLPVIYFAVPRLYVATSTRVTGAIPAPSRPSILWNADAIGVRR
ncbi:MAG: ABC transporter substrate-binding protein [Acidobacteriota bacterium]